MIFSKPIIPSIVFDFNDATSIVIASLMTVAALAAAVITAGYAAERYKGNKNKTTAVFALVTLAVSVCANLFYGATPTAVKGIVLTLVLLFASVADLKTKECPDYLHVMVLLSAFIGVNLESIPYMTLSAFFAGGVMLLTLLLTKSDVGGADIKMATAASFALGMTRGTAGLVAGMLLAILFNISKEARKKGFPMIPYLAAGYIAAFFIQV